MNGVDVEQACALHLPDNSAVLDVALSGFELGALTRRGPERGSLVTAAGSVGGGRLTATPLASDAGLIEIEPNPESGWLALSVEPDSLHGKPESRVWVVAFDADLTATSRFAVSPETGALAVTGKLIYTADPRSGIEAWTADGQPAARYEFDARGAEVAIAAHDTSLMYSIRAPGQPTATLHMLQSNEGFTHVWAVDARDIWDIDVGDTTAVAATPDGIVAWEVASGIEQWRVHEGATQVLVAKGGAVFGVAEGAIVRIDSGGKVAWRRNPSIDFQPVAIASVGESGIAVGGWRAASHTPYLWILDTTTGETLCSR